MPYPEAHIPTPIIDIMDHFHKSPWIISNDFLYYRVLILVLCAADMILWGYGDILDAIQNFRSAPLFDLPLWLQGMKRFTALAEFLLYLHTILACRVGLDKIYILHLAIYFPSIYGTEILVCISALYRSVKTERPITWNVVALVSCVFMVSCYIAWSIHTRILYILMYREAIEQANVCASDIFHRLLTPFMVMLSVVFITRILQMVCTILNVESHWLQSSHFGSLAFIVSFDVSYWIYELYMYFAIHPTKHLFSEHNFFEKIYLYCALALVFMGVSCIILEIRKIDSTKGFGFYYYKFIFYGMLSFLNGIRYIALWYYALSEWNVNDLSQNQLEVDLEMKYGTDSTSTMSFFSRLAQSHS